MPDVQLRTLRVSAELDASAYAAGAAEKAAADRQMSQSGREVGATFVQNDQKLANSANNVERVMRTFVAGYNETQRMTSALTTLGRALDTGAISASNADAAMQGIVRRYGQVADVAQVADRLMTRGQVELAQQLTRTNALLRQQSALIADNDNPMRGTNVNNFNTANIAAQFQDIAVTSAMGMSPLQIALQQGTQLSAVLGPMGAAGAVRSLGAAFLSIVSPVTLVTMGFVAVAAAAIQYLGPLLSQSDAANQKLQAHRDLISEVADKWGTAMPALKAYNDEFQRGQEVAKQREAVAAAIDLTWDGARQQVSNFNVEVVDAIAKLKEAGTSSDDMIAVQAVWNNLTSRVEAGKASFEDVRNTQTTLNLALRQQGVEVESLSGLWANLTRIVDEASGRTRRLLGDLSNPLADNEALLKQMTPYGDAQLKLQEYYRSQYNPVPTFPNGVPTPTQRPNIELEGDPSTSKDALSLLRQQAGARADIVAQIQAKQSLLQGQNDEIERLRLETQLIGASARERASLTAALQAEQQLRQQGINLASQEAQAYKANAIAIAQARLEIERQNAAFASLQQAGGSAIDSLTVGTGSLKDRIKAAADTMLQWIQQLAIANPLKNALFGSNLPTLSDLFSGKPAIPGATSTGMMTVTAGTVMVNGGVMGGQFPSIPGTTLPGTSTNGGLLSLIGATNGVRPSLTPSGIVNSPVALTAANQNSALSGLMNDPSLANRVNVSSQTELYRQAISKIESGSYAGNYSAIGPMTRTGDQAYGRYQVMGANVPSWSEKYYGQRLTPDQFLANKTAQDSVFDGEFGSYVSKYGEGPAATKWFTGSPVAKGRSDGYTVDRDYQAQFETNLKKLSSSTASTAKGVDVLGDSSANASSTITDSFSKLATPAAVPAVPAVAPATSTTSGGGLLGGLFGSIFKLFGFADGTENSPGGTFMVGERGRELVTLPRGSQVTPTHKMGPNSEERMRGADRNSIDVGVKVAIDQNGNLQAFVEGVSRRNAEEAARTGIRAYDARMPDRIDEISRNPYERAA